MSNKTSSVHSSSRDSRLLDIKEELPACWGVQEEANQSHVWEVSAVKVNRTPSAVRGHLPASHLDFLRINVSMEGAVDRLDH